MANSDKDILITPSNDADPKPEISFVGFNNAPIKLLVEDDNSLSYEGGAGLLSNLDNNLSANETFAITDESGIPVLAYNVDGTVLLSPFSGSTSVGTKKSVSRFHVKPDGNAPAITLPDETNPRYSVGFGSVNVSGVGQRLDFYTGDSEDNETNLGTQQLRMSLTANGDLGLATNNPGSMVDVRPITYASNQPSEGYQLGTTGGQWISKFFMRSNDGGVPFTGIATPADAEGDVHETFQVQGSASAYVRIRPGGTENLLSASVERVNINRDIINGNDSRSVLEVDGGIRIRDTQGEESPSKPGHIGLWEGGISSSSFVNSSIRYGHNNNTAQINNAARIDYDSWNTSNRTNYWFRNQLFVRGNTLPTVADNIDGGYPNYKPENSSQWAGGRWYPKEFTISSCVGNNGNISTTDGTTTSGTPSQIILTDDISRIYGPFPITNVTGWPTTAPTPNSAGNYSTYNVYLTLGTNSDGEKHAYEYGTGLRITGVGGGLDGARSVYRIQSDGRIRIRVNGSAWTGAASTTGNCFGRWVRTSIFDCGGASTAQTVSWNWYRTMYFKSDAANPARTLTLSGDYSNNTTYPDATSGGLRVYRDWSDSHYMSRNDYWIGESNRQKGWVNYCPAHMVYSYTRTGNENNQRMGVSRTDTAQAYRGHSYNRFGAYIGSLYGFNSYNRVFQGGRNDRQYGYYSEIRNGLYTSSNGYTSQGWAFYGLCTSRGTSRTNDLRGSYNYLRAGENTSAHRCVVNNARAHHSYIRADGGTITNGYLFSGAYRTGSNNAAADPPTQSIITNRWGLFLDDNSGTMKSRIDGRVTINGGSTVYTDATNEIYLYVNGSIFYNNHAIIASRGGDNSNVDHIWHNDSTTNGAPGSWHFCSDVGYKADGNSRIRSGQIDCGQSNGTSTFSGNLTVNGTKNFQIKHPVESLRDSHFLLHATVESPQLDLIYRGSSTLSNGSVSINIDEHFEMTVGTFVALNGDIQCFTTNESGWSAVRGRVENGVLTIECQDETSSDTISWMVVGRRIDEKVKSDRATTTDSEGRLITEIPVDSDIWIKPWDHELEGTTSGDGDDLENVRKMDEVIYYG